MRRRPRLLRDAEPSGPRVVRATGGHVFDASGRKYVDFTSGWCVGNLGWGNAAIRRAIRSFRGPDYVAPAWEYEPWDRLAEELVALAPKGLSCCVRTTGGSESVDTALQIAMAATGRRGFVSIADAYHGNSIGARSIGDRETRERIGGLLPHCKTLAPPLGARALDVAERLLKKKDVAAFVLEPVIINLGVLSPEPEFMAGLRRLCTKTGTLLIADEVATGFGRTGRMFAIEHYDVLPDLLCLAKAITGGCAGMGAVLVTDRVARAIDEKVVPYSTYGWHPLAVAAALANVRLLRRDGGALLARMAKTSALFAARLTQTPFRQPAEIRVKGLAIGIEFDGDGYAEKLEDRCRANGLLVSSSEDLLWLLPPLNVDRKTAIDGLDRLDASV